MLKWIVIILCEIKPYLGLYLAKRSILRFSFAYVTHLEEKTIENKPEINETYWNEINILNLQVEATAFSVYFISC